MGFAASPQNGIAYVPSARGSCRLAVVRISLRGGDRASTRRVEVRLNGGPIDSVNAQPALSPDGSQLALVVASQPTTPASPHALCGDTDSLVIVRLAGHPADPGRPRVRYVHARPGDQLDNLAWDHDHVLVRATSIQRPNVSIVRAVGPAIAAVPDAPVVLREPRGRYGPVFRYRSCRSVIAHRAIWCVRNGHLANRLLTAPTLPRRVTHVSVSAKSPSLLLLQRPDGTTYWWDGHATHPVPVTVRGRWNEPTW